MYPIYDKDVGHRYEYYRSCRIKYRLAFYTNKINKFVKNYKEGRCADIPYNKEKPLYDTHYRLYRKEFMARQSNCLSHEKANDDAYYSKYAVKASGVTDTVEESYKDDGKMMSLSSRIDQSIVPDINNNETQTVFNSSEEDVKENYTTINDT